MPAWMLSRSGQASMAYIELPTERPGDGRGFRVIVNEAA
jgi:hypothetical protein